MLCIHINDRCKPMILIIVRDHEDDVPLTAVRKTLDDSLEKVWSDVNKVKLRRVLFFTNGTYHPFVARESKRLTNPRLL